MKSLSLPGKLLLCAVLVCAPFSAPLTAQAAASSVYDKQPDVTEKELFQFLEVFFKGEIIGTCFLPIRYK